jgi:hypothetical protein
LGRNKRYLTAIQKKNRYQNFFFIYFVILKITVVVCLLMANQIFHGISSAAMLPQSEEQLQNSVFLDQTSRRTFQMSKITYPGQRRTYNVRNNIYDDRPTTLRNEQIQTHYERLARGKWGQGIGSYSQFMMHPVESHNLLDLPMESRFSDGVLRATAGAVDRLNLPLARRPIQLAPRGDVEDYGGGMPRGGENLAEDTFTLNTAEMKYMH